MATTSIDLSGVKAALGYQCDDATQFLTRPDPENAPIQFTLQATAESALFDIVVPIKYKFPIKDKAKTSSNSLNIRISPLSITSLKYSTKTDLPDQVKPIFPSAICLEMQLSETATILIPRFIEEPVAVVRRRSWMVLNSLYKLSHAKSLYIYILDSSLSLDQLQSISTAIAQRQLQPFAGQDHDVSRMFSGEGAKPTTLPAPLPPSYETVATAETYPPLYNNEPSTFYPLDTRPRKRKLSQDAAANSDIVLNKLEKLEAMFNRQREQDVHATNQSPVIQELRAEVAKLREQLATCQKKHEDLEVEVAELREQLARGQKKHKDLEAEVGELRDIVDDGEGVELADIQDDIKSLETRIDFVERGKDDDELSKRIKEEIFDEMAARVKGGQ